MPQQRHHHSHPTLSTEKYDNMIKLWGGQQTTKKKKEEK